MQRRRIKQTTSLDERLTQQLQQIKEQVGTMPSGRARDEMMRTARQAETAARLNEWLSSPGLQAPK